MPSYISTIHSQYLGKYEILMDMDMVLLEPTTGWLSVDLLMVDATAVLSVRGEVDLATAPTLREAARTLLAHGTSPVVVDLSEVPFMDSAGVHVLVEMLARLQAQNRRLAIACREHAQVHRLLALVGLLDAVTVHRSRESAVSGGEDVIRLQAP